ncbi:MAG: PAS domain S-box protein [Desulfobacterales bacterium]|nr:PAS domain S-box protein [Desulfobacterales bacterium]
MPDKPSYEELEQKIKKLEKEAALRKETEDELRKYRDLFENAPIGIFQSTVEGKILNINPAHARLFGYETPDDIDFVTDLAEDLYADPDKRKMFVDMALKHESLVNFENLFRRKDGTIFTGNLHVRVAKNNDGSVRYLEGFVEDITERRKMEQALRESEEKYRTVFENTGTGTIIIEEDMTISLANSEFERITGYTKAEAEGRMKWIYFVHPDDVPRMKEYHIKRRKNEEKVPAEYEAKIIDSKGNIKNVIVTVSLIPNTKMSVASMLDFTSRNQAEESLRERESQLSGIIEAFEGFIYICTRDYCIEFMNKALTDYTGYDGSDELCHNFVYGLNRPCPWCANERLFEGETVSLEFKSPKDGRWYYAVNSPIFSADNSVSKHQVMIIDINDRKLAEETLKEREEHLRKENIRLRANIRDRYRLGSIIGKSTAMQEVYELILRAASTDANIIIYGESGTGKELAARAIHDMSDRKGMPFVPVNSGAIPETLLESEFFGYKKGAFTGANTDKHGYLDLADRGTLFLDELGEIDLNIQVKLLRAIEGGGYTPVGGREIRKPDVRIIGATNRDLQEHVRKGLMREDFYYRVHIIPIYLPPLRERREDIPLLIEHFLKSYEDKTLPPITSEILETMRNYDWPGNVRELQNTLHRYITLNTLDFMGFPLQEPVSAGLHCNMHLSDEEIMKNKTDLRTAVQDFEKRYITRLLEKNRWHRGKVSSVLNIDRRTLFRKIKEYNIG